MYHSFHLPWRYYKSLSKYQLPLSPNQPPSPINPSFPPGPHFPQHESPCFVGVQSLTLVTEDEKLENLLFDDFFNKAIHKAQQNWRDVVAEAVRLGIPTPAFSTALAFFDGYRSERLPAALIQAQRDYFGAHTFRVLPQYASDKLPEGKDIHVNWVQSHTAYLPHTLLIFSAIFFLLCPHV